MDLREITKGLHALAQVGIPAPYYVLTAHAYHDAISVEMSKLYKRIGIVPAEVELNRITHEAYSQVTPNSSYILGKLRELNFDYE